MKKYMKPLLDIELFTADEILSGISDKGMDWLPGWNDYFGN